MKVGDMQSEGLFSFAGFRRFSGTPSGTWGGLSPDGYRLYVEDTRVQELYSLQLQFPWTFNHSTFVLCKIRALNISSCPT